MLHIEDHGPVRTFSAARAFFGRSFYHTAAYWLDGLLVDSTCPFTAQELLHACAELSVRQVVNTHCHEDHIGGNSALQRARDCAIWAHPLALPILENPRLQPLQLYRRVFWGWPEPSHGRPVGEWVETEHHRFQVLHTPGHSPDHVCLYEPQQGWLFSGDAYIGGEDRAARPDYDIYAIIGSLKKLAALNVSQLFPASGTVRDKDPADDILRKIDYLEDLGDKVRQLRGQGLSVQAIGARLLGPEPSIRYLTLGHFRRRQLVEAYLRARTSEEGTPS
jgi:glyoxylase-like metal-dependent hydrolase (beta-lactamase superfamily II)